MQNSDDTSRLRAFGLIVGGICAGIGLWPILWRHATSRLWMVALAGLLLLAACLAPRSLRPVYRLWMAFGDVLGWINTRIILALVFYAVIAPMGLLMRALGKDPMRRQLESGVETYRVVRQPRPASHMTHQF